MYRYRVPSIPEKSAVSENAAGIPKEIKMFFKLIDEVANLNFGIATLTNFCCSEPANPTRKSDESPDSTADISPGEGRMNSIEISPPLYGISRALNSEFEAYWYEPSLCMKRAVTESLSR